MAKAKAILELPVSFKNLNVGDEYARLGISISRANLTANQADKHLCGRRLTGKIVARSKGASSEQPSLDGMDDDITIKGVFDVKGVGLSPKAISTGLTFAIKSVDISTLAHFAKRQGLLIVEGIEDLPEPEEPDADQNGDDDEDDE